MKAELFSSDFMISFFIFLSALIIITLYYQNLQTDVSEADIRNNMYTKSIEIGSLLATTNGQPQYWNSTNVEVIGLYDDGKFNLTKFEELKKMNKQTVKTMLGVGAYNFNITLTENNTEKILQKPSDPTYFYTCGTSPDDAEQLVLVKRLGVVNLEDSVTKVTMEVILWS
jgi:hypothetical protein